MTAVPTAMPETTPAPDTVATDELLLLHTPPEGVAVSGLVPPMHNVALPDIAGLAVMVIVLDA